MNTRALHDWLSWIESLNPEDIDMGLERIRPVYQNLLASAGKNKQTLPATIIVAGTNGKGSCVAMLESILLAAGLRVATYTSPHLLSYNERVRINGDNVTDETLCESFHKVNELRNDVPLTYFEFGTLSALAIFLQSSVDVMLLEVGLGGRLDAVNIVDADVSLVTSIGIDHTQWLGNDRESIGREKAGIFRKQRAAVCADPSPPRSLVEHASLLKSPLYLLGDDFGYNAARHNWSWWGQSDSLKDLPMPGLKGRIQLQNASAVIMVLQLLGNIRPDLLADANSIASGLGTVLLAGRFQEMPGENGVQEILDVAHNADGIRALADTLREYPVKGSTYVVIAMLADKDFSAATDILDPLISGWFLADLQGVPQARCREARTLQQALRQGGCRKPVSVHADVTAARQAALTMAHSGDRIVILGSFYTVGQALQQRV